MMIIEIFQLGEGVGEGGYVLQAVFLEYCIYCGIV